MNDQGWPARAADVRPAVLRTDNRRQADHEPGAIDWRGCNSYRLLGVIDGTVASAATTCRSDEAFLVVPGDDPLLQVAPASRLAIVVFDLTPVPVRAQQLRLVHCQPAPQPTPEQLWGRPLPRRIAGPFGAYLVRELQVIGHDFWRSPGDRLRANARLGQMLADLLDRSGSEPDWRPVDAATDPILALKQRVVHRLPQLPSIAEMAASLGWSRPHFSRRFRQSTGSSPSAWLDRIRWREASRQLAESNRSIAEIARLLGFRNAAAFSVACKRRLGLPPRAWRQAVRRGDLPLAGGKAPTAAATQDRRI